MWALTSSDAAGGGLAPFVHMGTPEENIRSGLAVPFGTWVYCALTVEPEAGRVTFAVDGASETLDITPPTRPLRGDSGRIGFKRFDASGLTGFVGEMGAMALFSGMAGSEAEHTALREALEAGRVEAPEVGGLSPTLGVMGREGE